MGKIQILIGGDLVINKEGYSEDSVDADLKKLFALSDLNILNLECPVTDAGDEFKILKTGPHLKGNSNSLKRVLACLNTSLVTLANNHLLDFGTKGIEDTLEFCKEEKISVVGGGRNLSEACRPFRTTIKGKKISVVNFAENEWASASDNSPGANPMDLIDNIRQIQAEKKVANIVIVIVHGGHEYYNLPSPRMVKQYRFYAENGADLVVGHHTHCISGHEVYNNVPIFYSLGNFLFTKPSNYRDWYLGLVLAVEIDGETGKLGTQLHPVKQGKDNFHLSLLDKNEKIDVEGRITDYNAAIADPSRLNKCWKELVETKYKPYLRYWSPLSFVNNRYIAGVIRRLGLDSSFLNKKGIAMYQNLSRCEAHSDMSKEVFDSFLKRG